MHCPVCSSVPAAFRTVGHHPKTTTKTSISSDRERMRIAHSIRDGIRSPFHFAAYLLAFMRNLLAHFLGLNVWLFLSPCPLLVAHQPPNFNWWAVGGWSVGRRRSLGSARTTDLPPSLYCLPTIVLIWPVSTGGRARAVVHRRIGEPPLAAELYDYSISITN